MTPNIVLDKEAQEQIGALLRKFPIEELEKVQKIMELLNKCIEKVEVVEQVEE
jgi:hypothetical protein